MAPKGQTRREWVKRLAGGAALAALAPWRSPSQAENREPAQQRSLVFEDYIAGYQHHQGPTHEHLLQVGDRLDLRHEPDNPHDENALALLWRNPRTATAPELMLGYVPRAHNLVLANLLRANRKLVAEIAQLNPNTLSWERLQVSVYLISEENV